MTDRILVIQRKAQINLIYPAPTREPRYAGIGYQITATYVILFESIDGNMGDPSDDVNESGSTGLETTSENLGCVCWESA
jgi:hypothetical protein